MASVTINCYGCKLYTPLSLFELAKKRVGHDLHFLLNYHSFFSDVVKMGSRTKEERAMVIAFIKLTNDQRPVEYYYLRTQLPADIVWAMEKYLGWC
jgi:hypothetical protein